MAPSLERVFWPLCVREIEQLMIPLGGRICCIAKIEGLAISKSDIVILAHREWMENVEIGFWGRNRFFSVD